MMEMLIEYEKNLENASNYDILNVVKSDGRLLRFTSDKAKDNFNIA